MSLFSYEVRNRVAEILFNNPPVNALSWHVRQGLEDNFAAALGDDSVKAIVLRCAGAVRDLSISGAFRIDDTDAVLENLTRTLPVKLRYLTRYWVSVEAV